MRLILILGLCFIIIFSGCKQDKSNDASPNNPYMKISNVNNYDQTLSNDIKQRISLQEEISIIHVVNNDQIILIAFDVDHHHRFSLRKIAHELEEELKDKYTDYYITVSTDQKILLELEKLEQKLKDNNLSKKELNKELEKIIKLSKDDA